MDIVKRLREQADSWLSFGWDNDDIFDDAANEIERLKDEVKQLVKERNRYKRVCLKIVGDSKEESDISDFVLYLAEEALKEGE